CAARVGWWLARSRGSHLYRSGPLGRSLSGTHQLPGVLAPTRLSEHEDAYGRRCALLYTPRRATYSIVIGTEPDGAALVDMDQVDRWVARWGLWLAHRGDEPRIAGASVTVETAPDTGTRLEREVTGSIDPSAPEFARQVLSEVVATYPAGSSTVRAYVSITFNAALRAGAKRLSADEMGRELAARLPGLTGDLQGTGAGSSRPLSAQQVCELVRVAYDPACGPVVDQAHADGQAAELTWSECGPASAEARWDSYQHDSAYSCTWTMSQAPRGHVRSDVLTRLLAPHGDVDRKRVTLLYRPVDPARAAALVEADLSAAQFVAGSEKKPAARSIASVKQAAASAREEAAGAGLVQFGALVTATVGDASRKAAARAAVENLSAAARVRLRPAYGSQDSAFAACLPLGLVLPKHSSIPTEVREKL